MEKCKISSIIDLLIVIMNGLVLITASPVSPQEYVRLVKAAEIRSYINETIDPCENFYKFACGNWPKVHPAKEIKTDKFQMMKNDLDTKILQILKAGLKSNGTTVDKNAKHFFEACVKVKTNFNTYRSKFLQLADEFGGMPLLKGDQWDEEQFDWQDTEAKIKHKYSIASILESFIKEDRYDNTINRIFIGSKLFTLQTRSAYFDDATLKHRLAFLYRITIELQYGFGIDAKSPLLKETAKEIYDFELALAAGLRSDKSLLDENQEYILTTVDEMHKKYSPTLDIKKFVRITYGGGDDDDDEMIDVPIYEFMEGYQKNLIKVLQRTPKRIVANYIFYNFLRKFLVIPQQTLAKHEEFCLKETKKYFSYNLDSMAYRTFQRIDIENELFLIFDELLKRLQSQLLENNYEWIETNTRQNAIDKLSALAFFIYSGGSANKADGDNSTDLVDMNRNDYIANIKKIYEDFAKSEMYTLFAAINYTNDGDNNDQNINVDEENNDNEVENNDVDNNGDAEPTGDVSSSFSPQYLLRKNIINFPVAFLQPKYLLETAYPYAIKFGTIGALIGHEITHAFDDRGRNFDKYGNIYNWWDDASMAAFEERKQCFIDQYSQYVINGRNLTRNTAQGENIADNGGLRLAYVTYLHWYNNNHHPQDNNSEDLEVLPQLPYTHKQLFFISFAQFYCTDINEKYKDFLFAIDEHTPEEFRVIGTLSNFNEFAKEFNCPIGSVMNPTKKCVIY